MYPTQEELEAILASVTMGTTCLDVPELSRRIIDWHSAKLAEQEPVISAVFETEDQHMIGTKSATVKRVEHNDDGSITVVIDHWPSAQVPAVQEVAALKQQIAELEAWQAMAFEAHPNLDIDVEFVARKGHERC